MSTATTPRKKRAYRRSYIPDRSDLHSMLLIYKDYLTSGRMTCADISRAMSGKYSSDTVRRAARHLNIKLRIGRPLMKNIPDATPPHNGANTDLINRVERLEAYLDALHTALVAPHLHLKKSEKEGRPS